MTEYTSEELTKRVLVTLYNQVTNSTLSPNDVDITPPASPDPDEAHPAILDILPNTVVTMLPKTGSNVYGNIKLYYSRLDLDKMGSTSIDNAGTFSVPDHSSLPEEDYLSMYMGEVPSPIYTDEIEDAMEWLLLSTNFGLCISATDDDGTTHIHVAALTRDDITWHNLIPDSYTYIEPSEQIRYKGGLRQIYAPIDAKWNSYYCYNRKIMFIAQDYYPVIHWLSHTSADVVSGQDPIRLELEFTQSTESSVVSILVSDLQSILKPGTHYTWSGASATNGVIIGPEYLIVPPGIISTTVTIPTLRAEISEPIDVDIQINGGVDDQGEIIYNFVRIPIQYLPPSS